MAIVHNNILAAGVTGKVGAVYFRTVRGKQIMCAMPNRDRKWTKNQLASQQRFGVNAKKITEMFKYPEVKARYQARVDNNKFTAHMVALSDLMNPPKVKSIDASSYKGQINDAIDINIKGDLLVSKMTITIVSPSGVVVESGEAKHDEAFMKFHYYVSAGNGDPKGSLVIVTVIDFFGNEEVGKVEV